MQGRPEHRCCCCCCDGWRLRSSGTCVSLWQHAWRQCSMAAAKCILPPPAPSLSPLSLPHCSCLVPLHCAQQPGCTRAHTSAPAEPCPALPCRSCHTAWLWCSQTWALTSSWQVRGAPAGLCTADMCTDDMCTDDMCTDDMCTDDMCFHTLQHMCWAIEQQKPIAGEWIAAAHSSPACSVAIPPVPAAHSCALGRSLQQPALRCPFRMCRPRRSLPPP
jgi:hypothetical protein